MGDAGDVLGVQAGRRGVTDRGGGGGGERENRPSQRFGGVLTGQGPGPGGPAGARQLPRAHPRRSGNTLEGGRGEGERISHSAVKKRRADEGYRAMGSVSDKPVTEAPFGAEEDS